MQGPADPRAVGAAELLAHPLTGGGQLVEIDACTHAKAVQQVDHLLRGDVAGGAGGIGATTEPGHRAVDGADAALQRRQQVGQPLAIGVVKMDRQPAGRDLVQHRIQHGGHRARGADAYGVAEGYLVAAQIQQSLGHGGDPLGPGRAIERAGDDGGEVAAHLDAEAARLLHQGGEAHQRLLHADADVGPGKAVRAGGKEAYLVGAGGDGGLQPLQIGHQGAVTGCNLARQGVEQCGGIRHLRHLFG